VYLDKDLQDLLSVFNECDVRYLVVGGLAYSFHVEPRGTKDLDIWIESSRENSEKVFRALVSYGAPVTSLSPADFLDGKSFFQLGVAPNRVDVMQAIEGVAFADAWPRRSYGATSDGISFPVISVQDLIVNKTAVGRLQDLADLQKLRMIQE
jgi:hypothetical protein